MKKTIFKVEVSTGYEKSAFRQVYMDKHGDYYAKVNGAFQNVNYAKHRFVEN